MRVRCGYIGPQSVHTFTAEKHKRTCPSLQASRLEEVLAVFVSKATLSMCKGEEQKVVVAHLSKFVVTKSLQVTVTCIQRLLSLFLIGVLITVDVFAWLLQGLFFPVMLSRYPKPSSGMEPMDFSHNFFFLRFVFAGISWPKKVCALVIPNSHDAYPSVPRCAGEFRSQGQIHFHISCQLVKWNWKTQSSAVGKEQ